MRIFIISLCILFFSAGLMMFACTEHINSSAFKPGKSQLPDESQKIKDSYKPEEYRSSLFCNNCHANIFGQYSQSMHAKSFTNPVFQAQYFKELLPQVKATQDKGLLMEAEACVSCHAPIEYLTGNRLIISNEQVPLKISGVTCDFCHTIKGHKDKSPGNGNYISDPGNQKYGPFKHETNAAGHYMDSKFHSKSEMCGVCHNAVNHHGLEVKSTYSEWENSKYAKDGIQCQDCHMNLLGFIMSKAPEYESGKAARAALLDPPFREKLYTHRFPGAHSETQLIWSLGMAMATERPVASPGEEILIHLLIDNSRTGHKMPSGSPELRLLWIELKASTGGETIFVTASSDIKEQSAYDVSGKGALDGKVLEGDVTDGNRIYRSIFMDNAGKQTLSSYDAVKIIFDNRLNAAEIRKETYNFKIPKDVRDRVSFTATLKYLPYPSSFAKRLGLPKPKPAEIASSATDIIIN